MKEKDTFDFKIAHIINKLAIFTSEEQHKLIDAILETSEEEIFRSKTVQDFSKYHWDTYAKYPVWFVFLVHCFYMLMQVIYISLSQ